MKKQLEQQIVTKLRKDKLTLDDLAEELNLDKDRVQTALNQLGNSGVSLEQYVSGKKLYYHINVLPDIGNVFFINNDNPNKTFTWTFAYMGDSHVASIFHLPKTMHAYLDQLVDKGVKHVFHSGDVIDGNGIYKGHSENLLTSSVEKQTDMAAEVFGKYDHQLRFWAIAGNHDYSFTQQNGVKPLALIEAKADNFKNLGDMRADVIINGLRLRLLHGAGGRAYARSYPSQTYLRDYFSGLEREDMLDIPHFLLMGHFHTKYHGKDHGIEVFQPGSFQDGDNEFCIRRGLTGPNGAWVITVTHRGGHIDELVSDYIQPGVARKEKGSQHAKNTRNYSRR